MKISMHLVLLVALFFIGAYAGTKWPSVNLLSKVPGLS